MAAPIEVCVGESPIRRYGFGISASASAPGALVTATHRRRPWARTSRRAEERHVRSEHVSPRWAYCLADAPVALPSLSSMRT
jgi:hypothetical protein